MSKQEDITRIIDALATRGIECNEGTACYLRRRHQDTTENSISDLSLNEICNYLVGCSTHAKAPEWHAVAEGLHGEAEMSRQEDITRIIDALATRGLECDESTAYYLLSRHNMLAVGAPIGYVSSDEICSYLVGHGTRAKAPEWQDLTEKMPAHNESVLWIGEGGDIVKYGKGFDPMDHTVTHWMRIPDLPKPQPRCKICCFDKTELEVHKVGACYECLDVKPFTALVQCELISETRDRFVYDKAFVEMQAHMGTGDALDILLEMWEA